MGIAWKPLCGGPSGRGVPAELLDEALLAFLPVLAPGPEGVELLVEAVDDLVRHLELLAARHGDVADELEGEVGGQQVEERGLHREEEGLALLFTPPFDKAEPSPGYIKGYPPGVRENGGQYTHAALWFAMALARRGDGTRAVNLLRMLNPIEHSREPEAVWRYGIEPYAVAGDVYDSPGRIGHGGWSWYTGSAAWTYRAWVEEVLGLKVRGESLRMDPVIPERWEGFHLRYRHGEAIYEIQVENPNHHARGVSWVEVDGKRMADAAIPLERGLIKHRILVRMGEKE